MDGAAEAGPKGDGAVRWRDDLDAHAVWGGARKQHMEGYGGGGALPSFGILRAIKTKQDPYEGWRKYYDSLFT